MKKDIKATIELLYKRIEASEDASSLQTQLLCEHGETIKTLLKEVEDLKNKVSYLNALLRVNDEKLGKFRQYSKDFDAETGEEYNYLGG